jgi:hypothetical protein
LNALDEGALSAYSMEVAVILNPYAVSGDVGFNRAEQVFIDEVLQGAVFTPPRLTESVSGQGE